MNRTLLLLLSLVLLASGCAYNRVALPSTLPEKDDSLASRLKAYKKFSIQNGQQTTYLRNGVPQGTSIDFVLLGDGTRVEDARDLAPLVETNSAAGRFITKMAAEMASAKKTATIVAITSISLIVVGLAAGLPLLLGQECSRDRNGFSSCSAPNGTLGAVVLATGASAGYFGLNLWPFIASTAERGNQQDRASIFMTYNQSLRDRLALDDESLEAEQQQRAQPRAPSTFLIPAASLWLAHVTR
jgi:hypothetical protein